MKEKTIVPVRFVRSVSVSLGASATVCYGPGQIAAFREAVAQRLIADGDAVPFETAPAPAQNHRAVGHPAQEFAEASPANLERR